MKKDQKKPDNLSDLRHRAEEHVRFVKRQKDRRLAAAEDQKLLHELQVHQIELEMQNEELRKLQAEAEAAAVRYTDLYDFSPLGYFTLDCAGAILRANLNGARLLGLERARLVGKRFSAFVSEDDRPVFKAFLEKVFASQARASCEVAIRKEGDRVTSPDLSGNRSDDDDGPLVVRIETMVSADGQECYATVMDISERKQAEKALRESEEYFKEITENASDIIIITDNNGDIKYCSPSIERFAGYTPEDLIGRSGFTFIHPDDVNRAVDDFGKAILAIDYAIPNAFRIVHKDGSERYFEGLGKNLLHNPAVAGFIMNIRDITDRKKVEEEKRNLEEHLQRAEKMEALGKLAGGVAHDLNNVLGVLSGYSELLLQETPEGSQSRVYAEMILQSTAKGAAIIQDLLTLARRGVNASDVINLNSVVSGFLKTPVLEKMKDYNPQVTFRTECDKNLLNIKGSPLHLEKTLMNLVSNAMESISGKGEVIVRTESSYLDKPVRGYEEIKEGDYAVLTVSDTGIGIPAENREKIFEPFYTKKTMGRSGTGLGLSIVWGTVKDHDGYIDVQTEVGAGTTFTLYFPVTREELIAPQQTKPIDQYMGKGESVLVVDDVAEQRDIATRLLTRLEYQVHAASGGEEAVEYLKSNNTDILVLDMIMTPGIDGLETYKRILEINPKQKAIIVSGFSETDRVSEAQKLGAGAYIKKPYIIEKIGVAIRDELDRK